MSEFIKNRVRRLFARADELNGRGNAMQRQAEELLTQAADTYEAAEALQERYGLEIRGGASQS